MLGFVPVPKPVCGATFEDLDGTTHTCHRAAPYWTTWHIHVPFTETALCWPPKAERQANLATLTEARRALEWNDDPGQYEALNTAVAMAEKNVPFGRRRGWKYEVHPGGEPMIRLPRRKPHVCKAWVDDRVDGVWRRKCVRCGTLKPRSQPG